MPTYQYACTACGHQLEAVQSFADEPLTECPACEGRLRKLFSSVGIVFKGSGFYRTDSRGANGDGAKNGSGDKTGDSASSKSPADSSSNGSGTGASTSNGSAKTDSAGSGGSSTAAKSAPAAA